MRTVVFAALWVLPFAAQPLAAQEAAKPAAASPYQSVIGTVEKEDLTAKSFSIKPDKGDTAIVKFDDRTSFRRLPAGETDTKKATPITPADVNVGDRILARVWTDSPSGKPAVTFYVTKQADLAQRQQKTLEEWRTQSVSGIISALDKSAKTVTLRMTTGNTTKEVVVDLTGKVNYEHFSPETGKYEPSDGADIAVGDHLRAIGAKNADITNVKADAVQTGAIKTVSAQIKSIDAGGTQISAIEPTSKKPLTIILKPFSTLKRLDDRSAMMLALRLNPNFNPAGGGRGGRGGGAPGGGPAGTGAPGGGAPGAGGPAAGGPGPGGPGGGRGFGGGRGGMDPMRMIDQSPTIQVSELKPGEPLIVTAVGGPDASKLTAITLVAGVDVILRASPNNGADPLGGGGWNFGGGGEGGGGN